MLAAVAVKFKTSILLSHPFKAITMEAGLGKQIEVSIKACVDLKSPPSILDAQFRWIKPENTYSVRAIDEYLR
jgi:hypothetical protein